uniref:Uncharacterized protein n=1 Tax=Varanus komodoensis TaxID=61221 RepID=A0A8D2J8K0_VARKO
MITPQRRWLTLVALACCLAMLLSHGSTLRTAPEFPGKDASVDELVQFYNEVQQYLNSVSRPRSVEMIYLHFWGTTRGV